MKADLLDSKNFKLNFFTENKFKRQICKVCKGGFWSLEERENCGDPACGAGYDFIGHPIIPKKYDWQTMRSKFLSWFEKQKHDVIGRYPVVSRWKPDTFYTGASIYCFQPWVLNRTIEPPANPLVMSQPSVRFVDIDNVGLGTGRHLTLFEMMAHHAFNYPGREIYWKEKTVELCYNWLKELGIKPNLIVFKENLWEGGGYAGPCFEVLTSGNELATLVFMEYAGPEQGKYKPIDIRVVDTGYGLERHVWASQGHPTIYYGIFPEVIDWLRKKTGANFEKEISTEFCRICGVLNVEEVNVDKAREGIIDKVSKNLKIDREEILKVILTDHNIYQIADHTKAVAFILNDGVVPSNVQEGYLARLLIRRGIRSLEDLGLELRLADIVEMQIKNLLNVYPEFKENVDDILRMVEVEQKKYAETVNRGKETVRKITVALEKEGKFELEPKTLMMLYDSHGLLPRDVKKFAPGMKVELGDIETRIAVQKSAVKTTEKKEVMNVKGLPETGKLYYEKERDYSFKAKVLKVDGNKVVLDRTLFYPRGGGQEPDFGTLGGSKVFDVESSGNVVVHFVEKPKFKAGQTVSGEIDKERREQIRKHHTATHIINGAAKKVLGNHVWQAGSKKDIDKAHIDITHYETLTDEQVEKIERVANDIVEKNLKAKKLVLNKNVAEKQYGFKLYQGGIVPSKEMRIIDLGGFNIEACGGTHCDSTGEVGHIVIIKTERPQDGIVRLFYVAGPAAGLYLKKREEVLREAGEILHAPEQRIKKATEELLEEWKNRKKELEKINEKIATKSLKNSNLRAITA